MLAAWFHGNLISDQSVPSRSRCMRTYLKFATAAVGVAAIAAAMAPAVAATPAAAPHVLTIKKAGGTAVKVGAKLTAGIPSGKNATFALGSVATLTCTAA